MHDIADGKEDYQAFVSAMEQNVRKWYATIAAYTGDKFISKENKPLSCPFCGAKVIKKNG